MCSPGVERRLWAVLQGCQRKYCRPFRVLSPTHAFRWRTACMVHTAVTIVWQGETMASAQGQRVVDADFKLQNHDSSISVRSGWIWTVLVRKNCPVKLKKVVPFQVVSQTIFFFVELLTTLGRHPMMRAVPTPPSIYSDTHICVFRVCL